MILTLYDLNKNPLYILKNYTDLKIESTLSNGDKQLSFLMPESEIFLPHEYYIKTESDMFVIKENAKTSKGFRSITANLNLEELEGKILKTFDSYDNTVSQCINMVLVNTGWRCVSDIDNKKRNLSLVKMNAYQIIEEICVAYACEHTFDTLNKIIYISDQIGEDKGNYFMSGLNLVEVSDSMDTYEYYTRILPIGAEELSISSVNNGQEYIENYQYSNKVKTLIWEDGNYTDPKALYDDAKYKLNELSKPKKTFSVKIVDLAKLNKDYKILSYALGDTVTLIDNKSRIREKQRIVKMTQYPQDPMKNTCELSNVTLSFEEIQKRLFAAAQTLDNITTNNGTIKGETVDKITIGQLVDFETECARFVTLYVEENAVINDLQANYVWISGELGVVKATIGEISTTYIKATEADIKFLTVERAEVDFLKADFAEINFATINMLEGLEARIEKIVSTEITVEYLEAHYADINFANIDIASITQGFLKTLMVEQGIVADRVVGGEIVATDTLTGVSIYANDITAGTLSVERLILRGDDKSLIFALNNSGELTSKEVDTLDAYILTDKTITADKIVARSITSAEIDVANLVSTGLVEANKLTSNNINVDELFAQNIVIKGALQSSNYNYQAGNYSVAGIRLIMSTGQVISQQFAIDTVGKAFFAGNLSAPSGDIGGFTIGNNKLYAGKSMLNSTDGGVYLGTDGISCGSDFKVTSAGNLTANNVYISGTFKNTFYNVGTYYAAEMISYNAQWYSYTSGVSSSQVTTMITPGMMGVYWGHSGDIGGGSHKYGISASKDILSCDFSNNKSFQVTDSYLIAEMPIEANTMYTSNWYRSTGNTGWYNQTWGGGWYMTDADYIRNYNSKHLLLSGNLYFGNTTNYITKAGDTKLNTIRSTGGIYTDNNKSIYSYNTSGASNLLVGINNANVQYLCANSYTTILRGSTVYLKSTSTTVTSDRRYKYDIKSLMDSDQINYEIFFDLLEPVIYKYKDGSSGRCHVGLIAQDVEEALYEAGLDTQDFAGFKRLHVTENEDDTETVEQLGLSYEEFIMLSTMKIKKLEKKIEQQENDIEYLKYEIQKLKERI